MRIVLAGGGTGGHVFPAIAVAQELRDCHPEAELSFMGSAGGMEAELVPRAGFSFEPLVGRPLLSAGLLRPMTSMLMNLPAALSALRRIRPDAVLGTGGYSSAVTVFAAAALRVPTMVLDFNAFPGRVNRLLSPVVDRIGLSFHKAMERLPAGKCVVTGTPLRREFLCADRATCRAQLAMTNDELLLLVYGGSQGARSINQALTGALERLLSDPRVRVAHVTGKTGSADAKASRERLGACRYHPMEFAHNMHQLIAAADVAVCRAGGGLFELAAHGVPMVLAPLPNARDDHQLHNARIVSAAGAGRLIEHHELTSESLLSVVGDLLANDAARLAMSACSRAFAIPDAAARVAREMERLAVRR